MSKSSYHVIPALNGGWSVLKRGSSRASKHFDTRQGAIEYGRALSQRNKVAFVIHKWDGTVESQSLPETSSQASQKPARPNAQLQREQ